MRKILYSILGIGLFMASCTNFDDPVTEKYGDGPAVSIDVTATTDSTFTFTVSPANGTQYYSYIVMKADAPKELSGATLLKGGYSGGIAGEVVSAEKNATITNNMRVKGAPLCMPNTTYQIYAVAANDKGITGAVANVSVTTTDGNAPTARTFKPDTKAKAAAVTFSEAIARSNGAIVAQYYKEWDINNAVTLTEEEYTVSIEGSVVTFSAPEVPAGSILTFSWESGAFVDSFGNKCTAMNSGINMTTGKFSGVYVATDKENFAVADSCFIAPEIESVFPEWEKFEGKITFEFDVYRNENSVKPSALSVVYSNDTRSTTIKLDKNQWSVSGKTVTFHLPSAPQGGDIVSLIMEEGAITDVYGNQNDAYSSEDVWWKYFAMTKEMVLGNFNFTYISADDGKKYDTGIATIIEDPETENGVIIKNLYMNGSEVPGRYDITTGKFYVGAFYSLGVVAGKNQNYGLITYSLTAQEEIAFTVNADGTIVSTDFGVVACDENFTSAIGWWEKAATATLTPAAQTKAAVQSFGFNKKATKIAVTGIESLGTVNK